MSEKVQPQTILMAMTGGQESSVCAYLLKKQGHKCIGVGIKFIRDDDPFKALFKDIADIDLNKVKEACDYLDIPFYAIDATDEFEDKVVDIMVGRILSGQTVDPLVLINKLIFDILSDKAKKLNADYMASAHYAKILKNQKNGHHELHVANEIDFDQSYLLSMVDRAHLPNIILPLAEIRKKEVQKIAELINISFVDRSRSYLVDLMKTPEMAKLVESKAARGLRREGSIYDYGNLETVGEHKGIHHFYIGQSNLKIESTSTTPVDSNRAVIGIIASKRLIYIDDPKRHKTKDLLISEFNFTLGLDVSRPLSCVIKIQSKSKKFAGKLYIKNNDTVHVSLDTELPFILPYGSVIVVYNNDKERGKILGAGFLNKSGRFSKSDYNTLVRSVDDEDGNYVQKPSNNGF